MHSAAVGLTFLFWSLTRCAVWRFVQAQIEPAHMYEQDSVGFVTAFHTTAKG